MKRVLLVLLILLVGAFVFISGRAFLEARADADDLMARADALISAGRGGDALGDVRLGMLLAVQDPGFADHAGSGRDNHFRNTGLNR